MALPRRYFGDPETLATDLTLEIQDQGLGSSSTRESGVRCSTGSRAPLTRRSARMTSSRHSFLVIQQPPAKTWGLLTFYGR